MVVIIIIIIIIIINYYQLIFCHGDSIAVTLTPCEVSRQIREGKLSYYDDR